MFNTSIKSRWLAWLSFAFLFVCAGCAGRKGEGAAGNENCKPGPGVFFVATNGNDQWSGALPAPNCWRKDGPFLTASRALEAARAFKLQASTLPAKIFIRRGVYFLDEPLDLKPEDSGLTLAAYAQEAPVLSGGRAIAGWQPIKMAGRQLWVAEVPDIRAGKWNFIELWTNGKRAIRSRHPDHGYLKVVELLDKVPEWSVGQKRFRFAEGDLKALPDITNAEVVVTCRWVESRLPIDSVDEKERLVTFGKKSVFELAPGDLYYVEGALDFLDQPGEWALDRVAGRIYYWPRAGESLEHFEAIAPALTQLVEISGNPDAGKFVEHLTMRGLRFAHSEWYFPADFVSPKNKPRVSPEPSLDVGGFAQAAIGVPGAVRCEGLRECLFEGCNFSSLGSYALELGRGCTSNRIQGCEFSDLGGGGIKLGETRIATTPETMTQFNEITGCQIHDGGIVFHSAEGIWIGQSPNNRITHNIIRDFYYTGISIGWTWGYKPALASNNLVEFNQVHHIGVKSNGDGPILSDMGGIYTLGRQPGTTIRNNVWHDIAGLRYGGWGIYFDEGSSGIIAENNLVYRTTHGGFHQHYGETNVVRNNIFAFGRDAQIQRTRPEEHISFIFEHNIVYFDSGTLLAGDWSNDHYVMDDNIYFDTRLADTPDKLSFAGATLAQWHARGHDVHSLITNPLFVAPEKNKFRFQTNSPSEKMGFKPFDAAAGN